jgi:hypothetical protein
MEIMMSFAIYCRSHDEVNIDQARSWCDQRGLDFQLAQARDELFPRAANAVAIDLNHLGLELSQRALLVRRLCSVLVPYAVALASYDEFDPDVMAAVAARGVVVFRNMGPQMLKALAGARVGGSGELAA